MKDIVNQMVGALSNKAEESDLSQDLQFNKHGEDIAEEKVRFATSH